MKKALKRNILLIIFMILSFIVGIPFLCSDIYLPDIFPVMPVINGVKISTGFMIIMAYILEFLFVSIKIILNMLSDN